MFFCGGSIQTVTESSETICQRRRDLLESDSKRITLYSLGKTIYGGVENYEIIRALETAIEKRFPDGIGEYVL